MIELIVMVFFIGLLTGMVIMQIAFTIFHKPIIVIDTMYPDRETK